MSTKPLPQVELIDFDNIDLIGDQSTPDVVEILPSDGFFLNTKFTSDFRTRKSIYKMLQAAQKHLPENYYFMIYEAYRPLARQIELWEMARTYLTEEYPTLEGQKLRDLIETFVADPHNGIGSGHQACCALDISLCDAKGQAYDMGSQCQEICEEANTANENISSEARKNRDILVGALETEGFINYASEWWHFSYGDHQWAYLTNQKEAFFGPIDI